MTVLDRFRDAVIAGQNSPPTSGADPLLAVEADPFWVIVLDENQEPLKALLVRSVGQALCEAWPDFPAEQDTGMGLPRWRKSVERHLRVEGGDRLMPCHYDPREVTISLSLVPTSSSGVSRGGQTRSYSMDVLKRVSREPGYASRLQRGLDEVVARRALLNKDSGDYEGVLRRVEALSGKPDEPLKTCAVCAAVWSVRRSSSRSRSTLLHHLCSAGHVALELGEIGTELQSAWEAHLRGEKPIEEGQAPTQARDKVVDHIAGLTVLARHAETIRGLQRVRDDAAAFAALCASLEHPAAERASALAAHITERIAEKMAQPETP